MRKSMKTALAILAVLMAAIIFSWNGIKMRMTDSATYTQDDASQYEYFTPDLLKEMPRISHKFDFDYAVIDGNPRQINAIKFYGTENDQQVISYLKSRGFSSAPDCNAGFVCWSGSDPKVTVSVGNIKPGEGVIVVMETRFGHEN